MISWTLHRGQKFNVHDDLLLTANWIYDQRCTTYCSCPKTPPHPQPPTSRQTDMTTQQPLVVPFQESIKERTAEREKKQTKVTAEKGWFYCKRMKFCPIPAHPLPSLHSVTINNCFGMIFSGRGISEVHCIESVHRILGHPVFKYSLFIWFGGCCGYSVFNSNLQLILILSKELNGVLCLFMSADLVWQQRGGGGGCCCNKGLTRSTSTES